MKRFTTIFTTLILILSLACIAQTADNRIHTICIFNAQVIADGASATSAKIDLSALRPSGYFTIQIALTGDGTAKAEYLLSIDDTTYLEPTGAADIFTGFIKTSGPGADGKDIFSFEPKMGPYLKIEITETGVGADPVTVTVTLAVD